MTTSTGSKPETTPGRQNAPLREHSHWAMNLCTEQNKKKMHCRQRHGAVPSGINPEHVFRIRNQADINPVSMNYSQILLFAWNITFDYQICNTFHSFKQQTKHLRVPWFQIQVITCLCCLRYHLQRTYSCALGLRRTFHKMLSDSWSTRQHKNSLNNQATASPQKTRRRQAKTNTHMEFLGRFCLWFFFWVKHISEYKDRSYHEITVCVIALFSHRFY